MSTGSKIVGTAVRGVVLVVVGFALFDVPALRGLRCWQPYGHSDVSTTGARIDLSAHIALDDLATVVACVQKD